MAEAPECEQVKTMTDALELAELVRSACLKAALHAYEQAGMSGLCGEGRWELAVQAIRTLDLSQLLPVDSVSKESLPVHMGLDEYRAGFGDTPAASG